MARPLLATVLLGLCASAQAAPQLAPVLLPAHPLSADGAHVHTLRLYLLDGATPIAVPAEGLELRAREGAIVGAPGALGDGGLELRYRPPRVKTRAEDALTLTARGQRLTVPVPLEPAGRVRIELKILGARGDEPKGPDTLILGKGAKAEVRVSVRDTAGRPARAPLRLGASVGTLSALEELAPGEYRATYRAPEEKFPQVAILAALSIADGAFQAAPLKLAARVTVPGEGEPGGAMSIIVDGRTFGPQPIGPDGRFALPIVVPPGGRAFGESVDAVGNHRRREIDLQLPRFQRLLLMAVPGALPADGRARAEIVAFAVDARGNPERNRAPALTADRGTLGPPEARSDGLWSWPYTAPAGVADGRVTVRADKVETRLELHPAPPFRLAFTPPDEPLGAGAETGELEVRLEDAAGSPVSGARLEAQLVGGKLLGVAERAPGHYALRVQPPRDPGRGTATLRVELGGFSTGAPRRVSLHPARAQAGRLAAEAWVDDDLGLPVPGAKVRFAAPDGPHEADTDRFGVARLELDRPPSGRLRLTAEVASLPGLTATLDWLLAPGKEGRAIAVPSERASAGAGVLAVAAAPPTASLEAEVPLLPAAPVDLRLLPEARALRAGQSTRVRVEVRGRLAGPLRYQASAGRVEVVRPVEGGAGELRFIAPPEVKPGQRFFLSATDPLTRVTAFVELAGQ